MSAAAVACLCLLSCGVAHAEEAPSAELGFEVGLSSRASAGIFTKVKLTDSRNTFPPPLHTLNLVGDIGSVDLRGVPTCKPSARSPLSSGCTTPQVGAGGGYAILDTSPEDEAVKLPGTIEIFSGGQRGSVSKLWAWAVFPPEGFNLTNVLVIPITVVPKGPGRSEVRARLPQATISTLSITELRLSIRRSVRVDGRPTTLASVDCPAGAGAEVRAEATFYDIRPAPPVEATASPRCS